MSALQKSIRRSNVGEALYWATELGQFNIGWLWKRLRIISSEDVSPTAGVVADIEALYQRYREKIKSGDSDLGLYWALHATVILATAPKGRLVDVAWGHFVERGDRVPHREIPDYALDGHTIRGRRMGRRYTNTKLEPFEGSLEALEKRYSEAVA